MKIGDRIYVRGYIDEIRKDTIIIRNAGGYFGTIPSEVITGELPSAQPDVPEMNVGDMIYRQVAMEMLMAQNVIMDGSEYHNGFNAGVNRAQEVIRNLPPVQPKRGKWIERESDTEDKENGFETVIVCSRCDYPATTFYSEDCESRTQIRTAFCPTCGADMRGGEE